MNDKILLLDVMSTLVHDPFYIEVPAFFGMSLDEILAAKHPTAWVEFELDRIDEVQFLDRFFADGRSFDGAGMKDAMRAAYRYLDGIEPLLQRLRDAGIQMHALSNYPRWYQLIEERLQLSRYLSWSFVSCELGVRKPDPEAYRRPASRLGVGADHLVFVDDRQVNCDAAAQQGLHAIRFESACQLERDLAAIGVLPTPAEHR